MKTFATGSRVYGHPTDKSDYDICILVAKDDWVTWELLWAASAKIEPEYPTTKASFRFGNLNLIAFEEEDEFNAWHDATQALAKLPTRVTREEAVKLIKETICEQKKQREKDAVAARIDSASGRHQVDWNKAGECSTPCPESDGNETYL